VGTFADSTVGIYTFLRSLYRGGDSRFEDIRTEPKRFFIVFMLQGIWITFCTLPVVALNSIPPEGFVGPAWWTADKHTWVSGPWRMFIFWLGLWSFFRGFVIECLADWQLMKWRWAKDRKKHDEVVCNTGLWEKR
jgi:steroid 5-alpha reductase family enzyme